MMNLRGPSHLLQIQKQSTHDGVCRIQIDCHVFSEVITEELDRETAARSSETCMLAFLSRLTDVFGTKQREIESHGKDLDGRVRTLTKVVRVRCLY